MKGSIIGLAVALAFVASTGTAAAAGTADSKVTRGGPAPPLVMQTPPLRRATVVQTRPDESGQVIFSVALVEGQAYLKAEAPGIVIERTNTADGVALRVAAGNDVVEFSMQRDGRAAVGRQGRVRRFGAISKLEHIQAVQMLTAGSTALQAFDALVGAIEESERPEAISLLVSHALVGAMHGHQAPARLLARKIRTLVERRARPASMRSNGETGPRECWGEYERTVAQYANEYQTCYNSWWWNPFYISGCNFVWITKAELAWFWLLSCSGGVPIA